MSISNGVVLDTVHQRVIAYSSYSREISEWDGASWTRRPTTNAPSQRFDITLAFDPVRQRVVLFGGFDGNALGDTWEFDGTNWLQRTPATSPAPRHSSSAVYDPVRQRVVLFGGLDTNYDALDDLWEWDGTNWTRRTTTGRPAARSDHAMVFDATRQQLVLYGGAGGYNNTVTFDDTWTLSGTTWTQKSPATRPNPREGHRLAFDPVRQRVILFGGAFNAGLDLWEWDGTTWRNATTVAPSGRLTSAMVFDEARSEFVLFGGIGGPSSTTTADTWLRSATGLWRRATPALSPPARSQHSMAYDSVRRRVVLFGGVGASTSMTMGDTWEWDGTNWSAITLPTSPPPRHSAAMVYDSNAHRVVLFGGLLPGSAPIQRQDTWVYDGSMWTQLSPAQSPPGRNTHMMAFDSKHNQVVLFSGYNGAMLNDTWTFDGSNWTQRFGVSPPGRYRGGFVFDPFHEVAVLFAGDRSTSTFQDTWAWTGFGWQELVAIPVYTARTGVSATWDSSARRIVTFGGTSSGVPQADAMWWEMVW